MQVSSITIAGSEWLPETLQQDAQITQDLSGRVATASLTAAVKDLASYAKVGLAVVGTATVGHAIQLHDEVVVSQASGRIFAGRISGIAPKRTSPHALYFHLACQDHTALLDSVVIPFEAFTSDADTSIITYLFATYLPAINTSDITAVATVSSLELSNVTPRQALEAIANRTGAEWYVDANKKLQYFASGSRLAPFDLDEGVVDLMRDGFDYNEEFPTPANRVTVLGRGTGEESVLKPHTPPSSTDWGRVSRVDPSWPPDTGGTQQTVNTGSGGAFNSKDAGVFALEVGLLRFDTSVIPDNAVIQSATLKLFASSVATDVTTFGIEYYDPANWPIDQADYTSTAAQTAFAFVDHATAGFSWRSFPLIDPVANINVTGFTGFRVHVQRVAVAPTGENSFRFPVGGDSQPVLDVAYTLAFSEVSATANDAVSQTKYGILERKIIDRQILSNDEAMLRAEIEVARFGLPQRNASTKIIADGLGIGQLVTLKAPSVNVEEDLIIRQIQMRWLNPTTTEYTLALGDHRPDLIRLLRIVALRQ